MNTTNQLSAGLIPTGDSFSYLDQTFCIRSDAQGVTHRPQEEMVIDWIRENEENEPIFPANVLAPNERIAFSQEIEKCVGECSALTEVASGWVRRIIARYVNPIRMPIFLFSFTPLLADTECHYGLHHIVIGGCRDIDSDEVPFVKLSLYVDGEKLDFGNGPEARVLDDWCFDTAAERKANNLGAVLAIRSIVDKHLAGLLKPAA